jgi:hypothetical protein
MVYTDIRNIRGFRKRGRGKKSEKN